MTKKYKTLILLLCVATLLCMISSSTFMIVARQGEIDLQKMIRGWLFNIPLIVFFVPICFYLIRMIHHRIHSWIRFLVDFITTSVFIALCLLIYWIVMQMLSLMQPISLATLLYPSVLWNIVIVMLIELFLYQQELNEREQQMILMEKEKTEYQFRLLKNQLNPHFLFNCLNVAASMAYQDGNKTNHFVKKLAEVYRYLLMTHDRQTVSLEEELRFTQAYLYLETIRFEEALQVTIRGDYDMQSHREIIPASLQMLVENAIKHNSATPESPLSVSIVIRQDGITVSNNLQLRSCVGSRNGMGLANLRNQYALHGKVISTKNTGEKYVVEIPFIQ